MRILQVRFKNLNSLAGEWQIDLTHPAFGADGIFAITGPTGAGKSTILDALCLALYGRTPRLNKVSKSANEIMSRQTGECFAEVTFETHTGRYCCHWSQRRARKKPGGELQPPKHEIANADSGEIFESGIKGVAHRIELVTGMDFDRFTRSMLLAQGGFGAFLQAQPDDRAPILEQITGTAIYSRISIHVHERQRREQQKLNLLKAEMMGIALLNSEQEAETRELLETKEQEDADLTAVSAHMAKAIAWLHTVEGLKKELQNLTHEATNLQSRMEAFEPDREKLLRALSAASLDGPYATLSAARKEQADDGAALKAQKEALPELEASVREQGEVLQSAELQTFHCKEEFQRALPILQKVRSLDQKLEEQKKAVAEDEEKYHHAAAMIEEENKAQLEEEEKHARACETLKLVEAYLKEHSRDEGLVSGLAGVEEQLGQLLARQEEILQKETKVQENHIAMAEALQNSKTAASEVFACREQLERAMANLQEGKDTLKELLGEKLLREYRTEKETLLREMAFLRKISELEDYRAKLEEAKPCPLCGATEHPFAEGHIPVPDVTEQKIETLTRLIRRAEDQEGAIGKLEDMETLARKNFTEAEKVESLAAHEYKAAEKNHGEMEESLKKLRADFAERRQAVAVKLSALGITNISEKDMASLMESLRERLEKWQVQLEQKTRMEKEIALIASGIKRLDAVIQTQSTALTEKGERLEKLKKELDTLGDERKALYGLKDPDHEEQSLHKAIIEAESAEKEAREGHHQLQQQWNTAMTRIESLKKRMDQREPELQRLEGGFFAALAPAGFFHEKEFLEARLSPELKTELAAKAGELDQLQTDVKARQKDRETRLAAETARKITHKTLEELEPQFEECEKSLKELRHVIAGLRHKLSENAAAREKIREKEEAVNAQEKECRRWDDLHELIGSADGKKYRNFAQGLTFEIMVGHANRQLQKMTDRYLLTRDGAQPLELNVVDNYQAGEIRSTKNLSGGESFIVSLSLALGLSHMASKNVRVDSLFLDEGFGTLDEEALDTALETLGSLHQDGKLIGVISHVPALKERISTQIEVIPETGGISRISGPGCERLDTSSKALESSGK